METKKGFKEEFAAFFLEPGKASLRNLLKNNLGEFNDLDFKKEYCTYSKIAKHILGISNTSDGVLIFGVEQKSDGSLESIGLEKLDDKTVLGKGIQKYLPKKLQFEIIDFVYSDSEYGPLVGKKFQAIFIQSNKEYIPYVAESDGEDIYRNRIYVRNNTNTEEANYEQIQRIISERIRSGFDSTSEMKLEEHFSQLKTLYKQIEKGTYDIEYENNMMWSSAFSNLSSVFASLTPQIKKKTFLKNKNYPDEEYDQFVNKMIELKKKRIEGILKR